MRFSHQTPQAGRPGRLIRLTGALLFAALLSLTAVLAAAPSAAWADDAKKPHAGEHHDHDGHDHSIAPAPPKLKLTPEQIAELKAKRVEADAAAEAQVKAMKLDPKLAAREVGFMDGKQLFTMGMSLRQAVKAVLAGGNKVTLEPAKGKPGSHVMQVITKDKKLLVFSMVEKGKEIHITGMKMSRLHGSGIMDLNAARGAFYMISCMARL